MDNFVCFSFQYLVILFLSKHVSSDSSSCIDEYCFTYPGADVTRSFDGAMSWCATNDLSTLAVVSNKSSQDALIQFLSTSSIRSPLYINAKLGWKDSTWYFVSGEQFNGSVENQSDIGKTSHYQLYAYLQRQSQVSVIIGATSPHEMNNYICKYTDDSGLNILPNTSFKHDGSIYVKYENETVGWFEARNRCYLRGGDLTAVSILTGFDTSWLNLSFRYWIGLRWKNRRWITKDNGPEIIYTRWSSGKPNNYSSDCVCIDEISSWNWTDCDCLTERSFVCAKYRSISTTTTLLSSSPSVQNFDRNSGNSTDNSKLAIGVGVGVGGGVLIILVVVIIIIVIKTRKSKQDADHTKTMSKGKTPKEPKEPKKPKETKVTQLTSDVDGYAAILAVSQPGLREPTTEPVVYATPEFLETN